MNGYTVVPSVEATDEYQKARQDIIKAKKSFDGLSRDQQEKLIGEFCPALWAPLARRLLAKKIKN